MRRLSTVLAVAAVLTAALPAPASEREPQLGAFRKIVIPTSANVPGLNNTFYRTKVSILNATGQTYQIQVILYGGAGQVGIANLQMGPHQVRNYENFLADVFDFSGAGALVFDSFVDGRDFIVTAEVYNDKAGCGRFKTVVTGGPILENTLPGFDSYSLGITVDANNRTNVGIFNDSTTQQTVTYQVYNASGTLVTTIDRTVEGKTWNQFGLTDVAIAGGFIKWTVQASAYLWAVTVSNDSGDGTFIPPADVLP